MKERLKVMTKAQKFVERVNLNDDSYPAGILAKEMDDDVAVDSQDDGIDVFFFSDGTKALVNEKRMAWLSGKKDVSGQGMRDPRAIEHLQLRGLFETLMVGIWGAADDDIDTPLSSFYKDFHDATHTARLLGGTIEKETEFNQGGLRYLVVRFRDGSRIGISVDGSSLSDI